MHPTRILPLLASLMIAAGAAAQTTRPTSRPSSPPTGLLAGPPVDVPDGDATVNLRRDRQRVTVPPRRWFRIVTELDLDRAQRREIRGIAMTLRREQREFQREHAPRMKELRQQLGDAANGGLSLAEIEELREEADRLRGLSPDVPVTQQRIWDLLTEPQQDDLRERLAAERELIAQRRSEQREMRSDERDESADERRRRFLESRRRE